MKKLLLFLLILAVIPLMVFSLRFIIGGKEDTWICENNQWVKHGNPNSPKPQTGCGENKTNQASIQITVKTI